MGLLISGYSLSTELNADWTHKFSSQPEIQRCQYMPSRPMSSALTISVTDWKGVYEMHNLAANTRLDSNFVKAVWNAENQTYTCDFKTSAGEEFTVRAEDIFLESSETHQISQIECDVLVSAVGGFSTPLDKPVGMKGLDLFKGPTFHCQSCHSDASLS